MAMFTHRLISSWSEARIESARSKPQEDYSKTNECFEASRFASDVSCVCDDEGVPSQHLKLHFNEVITENRTRILAFSQSFRVRVLLFAWLFSWGFARVDTAPVAC